jgi:hypothetical protein
MSEQLSICQCCGRELPAHQFIPATLVCIKCNSLPVYAAIALTRETIAIETRSRARDKDLRKSDKRASKLAKIAKYGKRCGACHAYKPASAYNACSTLADGLQPVCRSCSAISVTLIRSGVNGKILWHATRDALRLASAAALQPASAIKT